MRYTKHEYIKTYNESIDDVCKRVKHVYKRLKHVCTYTITPGYLFNCLMLFIIPNTQSTMEMFSQCCYGALACVSLCWRMPWNNLFEKLQCSLIWHSNNYIETITSGELTCALSWPWLFMSKTSWSLSGALGRGAWLFVSKTSWSLLGSLGGFGCLLGASGCVLAAS